MPLIAESPFLWSKNSISIPKSEVAGGHKFVETCANFPVTLATYDFATSVGVLHKSDSGTKLKVLTTRPETGKGCKLGLKLDRGIWLSRALRRHSAMSQKSDTPDEYSFKVIASHVVERTLYTLSTCCDIQTNRLKLPFLIGFRTARTWLLHVNEIIVPVPIAQCTVSDYR